MSSSLRRRLRADLVERPKTSVPALDGIRALGSVIVLVFHCAVFCGAFHAQAIESGRFAVPRAIAAGLWSGVDILFVLSGFLIGRILATSLHAKGALQLGRYVVRRAFRILPAYYLVLTLALFALVPLAGRRGAFPLLFQFAGYDELRAGAWTSYLFVSNYEDPARPSLMPWGWSVCVEWQFYVLVPLFVWALFQLQSAVARGALLAAGATLPVAGRAFQFARDPELRVLDGLYYYSHNRFDELMVGVVVAYLFAVHRDALERWVGRAGSALGVAGLSCWALVWTLGGVHETGAFAVVAQFSVVAIGTGLLIVHALFREDAITRFFAHGAWYPLSRISYGTYLLHPFVLFGLMSAYFAAGRPNPLGEDALFAGLTLATFAVTSLLAAAMFVAWERPFLDWGGRLADRERRPRAAAPDGPSRPAC